MSIPERIAALRKRMAIEEIDTYIITKYDPHMSEYAAEYWNAIQFISGFTGSNASIVITQDYCGLWTDGRYAVQAAHELAKTGIEPRIAVEQGEPTNLDCAVSLTPAGGVIGFDGRTLCAADAAVLFCKARVKKISYVTDKDLVGYLWTDRPNPDPCAVVDHPVQYAGVSRREKLQNLRAEMKERNVNTYIISSLDDIAWLFNLRGTNILFPAYAVIETDRATLFADVNVSEEISALLESDGIRINDYNEVETYLTALRPSTVVLYNPDSTSYALSVIVHQFPFMTCRPDITTEMKAIKNSIELECLEKVNIRDGVSMVRFLIWLRGAVEGGRLTEKSIEEKLISLRSQDEKYVCPSFDTIAAYMKNAAMMHYHAEENAAVIQQEGFLLVDSGAHYWDGTTDITRTIVMGAVSPEMKRDFTLVLRSHIALACAVFLRGATGSNLDVLARMPMWANGLDYKSGTGHGIGFCLNVHEGPQRISMRMNAYPLLPGMVVTNEPGVYKENQYGIRTENTMVVEDFQKTECGSFLRFKTISYCPIDLDGVDYNMLDAGERQWINDYHNIVREKLSPYLTEQERAWLSDATQEIG